MAFLDQRTQVCIAEGTLGTFDNDNIASANVIRCYDVQFSPNIETLERNRVGTRLAPLPVVQGARYGEISFKMDVRGSGAAGTAPDVGVPLLACGMAETIVISTSVTYVPEDDIADVEYYDISVNQDGRLHKFHSCRGTFRYLSGIRQLPTLELRFMGVILGDPTDAALVADPTFSAVVPPAFLGVTDSFFSVTTLKFTDFTLDLGNTLAMSESAGEASGYASCEITDVNPTGSIDPEAMPVATLDAYGNLYDGSTGALSLAFGPTAGAGNRITIAASQCQIRQINKADRDGILVDSMDLVFPVNEAGTNNPFSIAFT